MPGLGGFGHQTEKERKRLRQAQLAEEAGQLVANNEVTLDSQGRITGNKRDSQGNAREDDSQGPLPNLPAIEDSQDWGWLPEDPGQMEIDNGDGNVNMMAARSGAASGGPGGGVSKETPISNYPSLSYGIQETHTTILPWRS